MLFTHLYIESGKIIELNATDTDKSTILDQTLLIKRSTWVIPGKPGLIPLNTINPRY